MKKVIFPILFLLLASLWAEGSREKELTPINSTPAAMTLIYLDGDVLINGSPAEEGQNVPPGATVKTGQNIFRIEPDTVTLLDIGPGKGHIDLQKGSLALLLDKLDVLGLGSEGFSFTTPLTTAGIRGTAFFVKVESTDSVYFCCCNGTIDLTDKDGGTPVTLNTGHHHAVRYIQKEGKYTREDAGLLYHDDRDMDSMADKISVTIPWSDAYGTSY
ncbi:MAG: hypothetical protein JXA95_05580 [Spirochaetales bacterium]|nr:hypothetical protein [Spirochaetales bacterium]